MEVTIPFTFETCTLKGIEGFGVFICPHADAQDCHLTVNGRWERELLAVGVLGGD
jgi:hypothetical protein